MLHFIGGFFKCCERFYELCFPDETSISVEFPNQSCFDMIVEVYLFETIEISYRFCLMTMVTLKSVFIDSLCFKHSSFLIGKNANDYIKSLLHVNLSKEHEKHQLIPLSYQESGHFGTYYILYI